jgi:hypothetical protein
VTIPVAVLGKPASAGEQVVEALAEVSFASAVVCSASRYFRCPHRHVPARPTSDGSTAKRRAVVVDADLVIGALDSDSHHAQAARSSSRWRQVAPPAPALSA